MIVSSAVKRKRHLRTAEQYLKEPGGQKNTFVIFVQRCAVLLCSYALGLAYVFVCALLLLQ